MLFWKCSTLLSSNGANWSSGLDPGQRDCFKRTPCITVFPELWNDYHSAKGRVMTAAIRHERGWGTSSFLAYSCCRGKNEFWVNIGVYNHTLVNATSVMMWDTKLLKSVLQHRFGVGFLALSFNAHSSWLNTGHQLTTGRKMYMMVLWCCCPPPFFCMFKLFIRCVYLSMR